MKVLAIMSIMLTSFMMNTLNPMIIMLMILAQTLILCSLIFMNLSNGLMSLILFLIFIGGLMVLFIYITSLSSNEKLEMDQMKIKNSLILSSFMSMMLLINTYFFTTKHQPTYTNINMMTMIFSKSIMTPTILIMIYLLLTLIAVVKISKKIEGPLRNLNKK